MRRQERRRKFQEALLNTLYPESPQTRQEDTYDEHVSPSFEGINVDLIPDDYGSRLQQQSNDEDEKASDDGEKKLSRSQRKKIRKKKIKEGIARRRNIIGPLLNDEQQDTRDVRRNACEVEVTSSSTTKQNKMKQRREAKKLGKNKLKTSTSVDNSCEDELLESSDPDGNFKPEDCRKDA